MNRKTLILIFVLVSCAGAALLPVACRKNGNTGIKHVIMISLDTTRADMWGFYGNSWVKTPNLDALAQESLVLDDFMTVVPTTLASHTSLFTGNYPIRHGVPMNGHLVNEKNIMLAEVLRDEGFFTLACIGSYALLSTFKIDQGFNIYDEKLDVPMSRHREQTQRIAGNVTDAVIARLREIKADSARSSQPMFLFAHYFDPHAPYEAPQPYGSMYAARAAAPVELVRDSLVCGERHPTGYRFPDLPDRTSENYAGEVSYLDAEVGRLLKYLRSEGILDESLVVITSDHGETFWEHAPEFNHGRNVYQSVIRTVGMIRFPNGRHAGERYTHPAASIDIMPTILRALGIKPPGKMDGIPLALADSDRADPERSIFAEATQPNTGIPLDPVWHGKTKTKCIRKGRFKYTWTPFLQADDGPYKAEELFDVISDPCERNNLLDRRTPQIQSIRDALRSELEAWMKSANPLDSPFDNATWQKTHNALVELGYIQGGKSESNPPDAEAAPPVSAAPYDGPVKHVVLISLDTTRPDHFGAYGNTWIQTPAMDALARESIVFDNARTVVPGTLPSHASLFSGTAPHTHGTPYNGFVVNDANVMLAELLKAKGFATKGFIAAYPLNPRTNIQQGFDVWNQDYKLASEGGTGQRTAAEVTDSVLKELEANGVPERLFLFVHYFDPHAPYEPPTPLFEHYQRLFDSHTDESNPLHGCRDDSGGFPGGEHRMNAIKYAGEITSMDTGIGRLIQGLKEHGIYDDALIVVCSDHGENFWEHEINWDHGETVYETSSRIVCMARMPRGAGGGTRVRGLVSNIDLAPSILSAMGLPVPGMMEGIALDWSDPERLLANRLDFMEANQSIDHTMKISATGDAVQEITRKGAEAVKADLEMKKKAGEEVPWPNLPFQRGVTDGRHKLIITPYRGAEALYDIVNDPCESVNLLRSNPSSEVLDIAARLRTRLREWDAEARPLVSGFDPVNREESIRELQNLGYLN